MEVQLELTIDGSMIGVAGWDLAPWRPDPDMSYSDAALALFYQGLGEEDE